MKLLGVGTGPDQVLAGALGAAHPEYAVRLPGFLAVVAGAGHPAEGARASRDAPGHRRGAGLPHHERHGAAGAAGDHRYAAARGHGGGARPARGRGARRSGRRKPAPSSCAWGRAWSPSTRGISSPRFSSSRSPAAAGDPRAGSDPRRLPARLHLARSASVRGRAHGPRGARPAGSSCSSGCRSSPPWPRASPPRRGSHRLLVAGAWFAAGIGYDGQGAGRSGRPRRRSLPRAGARPLVPSAPAARDPPRPGHRRAAGLPWYLAMYARHGRPFLDELVMRNMLGRTLDHLHDTNSSEDTGVAYFAKQLGYGTFPWSGLAAVAMLTAARRNDQRSPARPGARALLRQRPRHLRPRLHHGDQVPPLRARRAPRRGRGDRDVPRGAPGGGSAGRHGVDLAGLIAVATALTWLVARDFTVPVTDDPTGLSAPSGAARFFHLLTYRYDRRWISSAQFLPLLAIADRFLALALRRSGGSASVSVHACSPPSSPARRSSRSGSATSTRPSPRTTVASASCSPATKPSASSITTAGRSSPGS